MDEPTNHLDLESRETLIEALENFEGTVLMVAHDRHLLSRAAEQVWEFTPSGLEVYLGGYDDYSKSRKDTAQTSPASKDIKDNKDNKGGDSAQTASKPSNNFQTGLDKEQVKALRREKAELRNKLSREFKPHQDAYKRKEADLEKAITRQTQVESELALPEVYADVARTNELLAEFTKLGEQIEKLMEEMEKLELVLADFEARKAEFD